MHYFFHSLIKKHTKANKDFPDLSVPKGRLEVIEFWPNAADHQSEQVELAVTTMQKENRRWKRITGMYLEQDEDENDSSDSESEEDSQGAVPVLVWRPDFANASVFR